MAPALPTRFIVLFVPALAVYLTSQVRIAEGQLSALDIYRAQSRALVFQTVSSALLGPGHPSEVLVTIRFQLDRQGHLSSQEIVAEKGGKWAEDTARKAMNTIRFQPPSKQVLRELGSKLFIDMVVNVGFH